MNTVERKLRVFLCHASQDKPVVRELYQRLLAEGWIDPWLDKEKLLPGQDFDLEIEKAVESADVVIVFVSNNSVKRIGYVQKELRLIYDAATYRPDDMIFAIPLRLEECEPPRRFRLWHWADYFGEDKDSTYKVLLESLRTAHLQIAQIEVTQRANTEVEGKKRPERQVIVSDIVEDVESITKIIEPILVSSKPIAWQPDAEIISEISTLSHPEPFKPTEFTSGGHPVFIFGGIKFVKVPAGKFLMGSSDKDKRSYDNEKPQQLVDISYDYYIARFLVTKEQYENYVTSQNWFRLDMKTNPSYPLVELNWEGANEYCSWLNRSFGSELPKGSVFRLPTEAEWEKAARGTNGLIYPWGDFFDKDRCNTSEGKKGGPTPVGLYSPQGDSPYGCADMSGNVWEVTHSLFWSYPYRADDGREDETVDDIRVYRGGFHSEGSKFARTSFRGGKRWYDRVFGLFNVGCRVVIAPPIL
ncbi:MAG: SUMF1/EgtB/PvdO family nonheme iron enzyme [Chloroflexi bacterium]|nr:SUMF1/EgtB/PvdO family nonheme iron enzyme [Chloroflexota bacterium]